MKIELGTRPSGCCPFLFFADFGVFLLFPTELPLVTISSWEHVESRLLSHVCICCMWPRHSRAENAVSESNVAVLPASQQEDASPEGTRASGEKMSWGAMHAKHNTLSCTPNLVSNA